MTTSSATAPIRFAPPRVQATQTDGGLLLRSTESLLPFEPSLATLFQSACTSQPDRTFLAEPAGDGWNRITYAEARAKVDAVASALLDRGLSAERPVAILSGNSIDHAILMLAGHVAGIPVSPISVAYSLQSQDLAKLRHCRDLLTPGLVYAADTGPFGRALDLFDCEVVTSSNSANRSGVTDFADLTSQTPGASLTAATSDITGDTIAKFLFTSGSTNLPKAVINTHGMLTSNQQAIAQVWPFLDDQPLVLVDWLPWNHTFGGNHNFNMVLKHAGTLYIDAGKPVPALFAPTLKALSKVSPTICFNVPAGFSTLLSHLEGDPAFARQFFSNLRLIFYAGAALPQDLWTRLEDVAVKTTGQRIPMTSSWGLTETSPAITMAHFPLNRAGNIGVPVPGCQVKLAPVDDLLEARVKGPNITPGYWRSPDKTAEAFDEDGFYRTGDAVRLADDTDPAKGLTFNGRTAEDFKLSTGTWVRVGALRIGVVAACSPIVQDVVVAGEGQNDVRLLVWLNPEGCRKALNEDTVREASDLTSDPHIQSKLRDALTGWNTTNTGASMRVAAIKVLDTPPNGDANEITDKGYVNQRAALANRAEDVTALYASNGESDIIAL